MTSVSAPIASTGVPSQPATAASTPTPGAQAVPASQANPTGFDATPVASSSGSSLSSVIAGGGTFTAIAAYAQQQMNQIQSNISSLFKSEGGQLDAAKLQVYNTQMSTFELMMEQAAKLQDKQEKAAQVWVR